ncbi:MAG: TonB-dependent receptor plug domain-containing protein [Woeseiaceae bacterium]
MKKLNTIGLFAGVLLTSGWSLAIHAQGAANSDDQALEEIVVTGTHIEGARVNETLPVFIINEADIDAIGGIDGEDLIRSLPSQGAVDFRNDLIGTVNNARGDVASINLRSIGPGNTLTLLNGRRLVYHPGTQTDNLVPAVTVNLNSMPVAGIRRVEVFNDGASAIYGTDAVAGVFNTILRDDYEGVQHPFDTVGPITAASLNRRLR